VNVVFLADFPEFHDHQNAIKFLLGLENDSSAEPSESWKDNMDWYILNDFKLSPQTLVCQTTYITYFKGYLLGTSVGSLEFRAERKTALSEQTHMRQCFQLFKDCYFAQDDFSEIVRHSDLLVRAVGTTVEEGKAASWVVFAFQMFIDMHRELGAEVGRAHRERIDAQNRLIIVTLANFIKFQVRQPGRSRKRWYQKCSGEWKALLLLLDLSGFERNNIRGPAFIGMPDAREVPAYYV
jgi:hypothetical protein